VALGVGDVVVIAITRWSRLYVLAIQSETLGARSDTLMESLTADLRMLKADYLTTTSLSVCFSLAFSMALWPATPFSLHSTSDRLTNALSWPIAVERFDLRARQALSVCF
jgi:hypothetical protein